MSLCSPCHSWTSFLLQREYGAPFVTQVFPVLVSPADAEPVASCEENGVLGPIVGTVGSLAALEVIKAGEGKDDVTQNLTTCIGLQSAIAWL